MNKLLYRSEGSYNILDPRDKSAQYVFQFREDAPKELQRSFLIDIEKDGNFSGTALDVAYELKSVIDSYWINTDQPRIKAVVEYLEMWAEKDEYDELKSERERLIKRLQVVENRLGGYDPEEWDNWTPECTESTESA